MGQTSFVTFLSLSVTRIEKTFLQWRNTIFLYGVLDALTYIGFTLDEKDGIDGLGAQVIKEVKLVDIGSVNFPIALAGSGVDVVLFTSFAFEFPVWRCINSPFRDEQLTDAPTE